ncbi:MAG: NUDIX domain-containing protein [Actinomycetaceae bacterium]|nr:NUDIX domain-containing protein [Actinomycetaceae bacterium]
MREGTITVSAVIMRNACGHVLMVRKRGTTRFILPGGKPAQGEDASAAALREVREETGVTLAPGDLECLGTWEAAAANEADRRVVGTVFLARPILPAAPAPRAEIEQTRWLDPHGPIGDDVAALTREAALPALRAHLAATAQER